MGSGASKRAEITQRKEKGKVPGESNLGNINQDLLKNVTHKDNADNLSSFARGASTKVEREELNRLASGILGFSTSIDMEASEDEEDDGRQQKEDGSASAKGYEDSASPLIKQDEPFNFNRGFYDTTKGTQKENRESLEVLQYRLEETSRILALAFSKDRGELLSAEKKVEKAVGNFLSSRTQLEQEDLQTFSSAIKIQFAFSIWSELYMALRGEFATEGIAQTIILLLNNIYEEVYTSNQKGIVNTSFLGELIQLDRACESESQTDIEHALESLNQRDVLPKEAHKHVKKAEIYLQLLQFESKVLNILQSPSSIQIRKLQNVIQKHQGVIAACKFKRSARTSKIIDLVKALIALHCAIERRDLQNIFDWPGSFLDDGEQHYQALQAADSMLQQCMWKTLGLPTHVNRLIIKASQQCWRIIHENYSEYNVPSTANGNAFLSLPHGNMIVITFVESAAIMIQAAYRGHSLRKKLQDLGLTNPNRRYIADLDTSCVIIQRAVRAMLARKKVEKMKMKRDQEDTQLAKRFYLMPDHRMIKATMNSLVKRKRSEFNVNNQAMSIQIAKTIALQAPLEIVCKALAEMNPLQCAILLESCPISLSANALKFISDREFSTNILVSMQVDYQARLLMESAEEFRHELVQHMKPDEALKVLLLSSKSEEFYSLRLEMMHLAYQYNMLTKIGICFAQSIQEYPRSTCTKLIEHLQPYILMTFIFGVKIHLADKDFPRLIALLPGDLQSLIKALITLKELECNKSQDIYEYRKIKLSSHLKFNYVAALNSLLDAMQRNGHLKLVLNALSDPENIEHENFYLNTCRRLLAFAMVNLSEESFAVFLTWLSKHHTEDLSAILFSIYEEDFEFCSEIIRFMDYVHLGDALIGSMPSFAALLLNNCKDSATKEILLEYMEKSSPGFANSVCEAMASADDLVNRVREMAC